MGLAVDCTPWVRTGLIRESDAIDRNWAYWGTYTQVPFFPHSCKPSVHTDITHRTSAGPFTVVAIDVSSLTKRAKAYPSPLSVVKSTRHLSFVRLQSSLSRAAISQAYLPQAARCSISPNVSPSLCMSQPFYPSLLRLVAACSHSHCQEWTWI